MANNEHLKSVSFELSEQLFDVHNFKLSTLLFFHGANTRWRQQNTNLGQNPMVLDSDSSMVFCRNKKKAFLLRVVVFLRSMPDQLDRPEFCSLLSFSRISVFVHSFCCPFSLGSGKLQSSHKPCSQRQNVTEVIGVWF